MQSDFHASLTDLELLLLARELGNLAAVLWHISFYTMRTVGCPLSSPPLRCEKVGGGVRYPISPWSRGPALERDAYRRQWGQPPPPVSPPPPAPPPKSAAEFGRLRRFVPPICWVSGFRPFVLLICRVSVNSPIGFADTESVQASVHSSSSGKLCLCSENHFSPQDK